jgi:hypothetical protein
MMRVDHQQRCRHCRDIIETRRDTVLYLFNGGAAAATSVHEMIAARTGEILDPRPTMTSPARNSGRSRRIAAADETNPRC